MSMISPERDTWIYYVYLLEVASVYLVAMATNTVETTIFGFGCLVPRIVLRP